VTVVHVVVLRERNSLKQPAQVLQPGSQDVWVSGPMIVGGNIHHYGRS